MFQVNLAPEGAIGIPNVWDGGREVVTLPEGVEFFLAMKGLIEWSGIYKVYRCCDGVTLDQVKACLA